MAPLQASDAQRTANKWSARIIPAVLVCVVGYVTWAIVALLAVNYLIHPPQDVPRRMAAGIVILVFYFILLLFMAICYTRLVYVINTNPGIVPSKALDSHKDEHSTPALEKLQAGETRTGSPVEDDKGYLNRRAVFEGTLPPPSGLAHFYNRDAFECDFDGLPRYCNTCKIWKPDRSHHCSELGRCIYKMDHFCPWAGGIVGETVFNYFIQFCTYTALYCILVLVVSAYFTKKHFDELHSYEANWIATIGLASFFFMFTGGIAWNSLHFAVINTTTVDNLSRKSRTYHFAVLLPPNWSPPSPASQQFQTITYPLPSATYAGQASLGSRRTFAILESERGSNPYDISPFENFKEIMGHHWYEWFFPIRQSPACDHIEKTKGDHEAGLLTSMYRFGPTLEQMKRNAGIGDAQHTVDSDRTVAAPTTQQDTTSGA